jgi:hypothetical protein
MDYGDRVISTGTDDELLEIGNAACGVLERHRSFDAAVQALLKAAGKPRSSRHSRSCGIPC